MARFVHPSRKDITLTGVLAALSDPYRLKIIRNMLKKDKVMSCTDAAPCPKMAKSTLSHHFRILREAGLIHTEKKGVENHNTVRDDDINRLFPGLLDLILELSAR